jgi:phosphatidate cytidylyltransferase
MNGAMLKTRVLSALILVPATVAAVYVGGPVFDIFIAVAALIMSWEWARLTGQGHFGVAGVAVSLSSLLGIAAVVLDWSIAAIPLVVIGAIITIGIANWRGSARPIWVGAGALYIGLPTAALLWLRDYPEDGLLIVLWLLLVVWATDIGAYAAGRLIGGPKLAPSISPNKTWAGLAGGVLVAGATGAVLAGLVDATNAAIPAVAGGLLAVVAQLGDLFESAVKRIFGVKDSSSLIPGHGGLMDRVDGVVAVAPTLVLVNWLFGGQILIWR